MAFSVILLPNLTSQFQFTVPFISDAGKVQGSNKEEINLEHF